MGTRRGAGQAVRDAEIAKDRECQETVARRILSCVNPIGGREPGAS